MATTTPDAVPALKIRQRIEAASGSIRRLKRIDRLAAVLIRLGGLGIVISVFGILLFIVAEAWPLFRPARGMLAGTIALPAAPAATPAPAPAPGSTAAPVTSTVAPVAAPTTPGPVLAMGVDEYQMYLYAVRSAPRIEFFRMSDGAWNREHVVAGLAGAQVTAASRSTDGDHVALATADGRAAILEVAFRPKYEQQKLADLDIAVTEAAIVTVDAAGRPIQQVAYGHSESGRRVVAALVADDEIALWSSDESAGERRDALRAAGERITSIALGRGERLIAGTSSGNVFHWSLTDGEPRLTSISPVGAPVTAVGWALGGLVERRAVHAEHGTTA